MDRTLVALQEHLRDAGRLALVAVELVGRVATEEVRIDSAAAGDVDCLGAQRIERLSDIVIGELRVTEPGPEKDAIGEGPASDAGVALRAAIERNARGLGELGGFRHGDFVAGIETPRAASCGGDRVRLP